MADNIDIKIRKCDHNVYERRSYILIHSASINVCDCGPGPHADQTDEMVHIQAAFQKSLIFPICEKSGREFVKKGKGSVNQIENKVEGLHLPVNLVSPRTSHLRALDSRLSRSNWFLERGWTIMLR